METGTDEIAGSNESPDSVTERMSPEDRILQIVAKKGLVAIREIAQQTKIVNSQQAKPIVAKLVASGELIEIESKRTYRYALPE